MSRTRTLVVIPPSPPWWHAHRRGWVWMLCTDRFCEKPFILDGEQSHGYFEHPEDVQ